MSAFDWYSPSPPVACPTCHELLDGWQGKDGPCELFQWAPGSTHPIGQRVDDEYRMSAGVRATRRLPESFDIYTLCVRCGTPAEAMGRCHNDVWSDTVLVSPLEPPGLPPGWHLVSGDERAHTEAEIHREIPPGHALVGLVTRCLARAEDRDDVLVVVFGDGPPRFYVVHLTWRPETDARWPRAEPLESLAQLHGR